MLDGFSIGHWVYGFLSLVWTGDVFFGIAIFSVIHYAILWPALHTGDSFEELVFFQVGMNLIVWFGVFVGIPTIWALRAPTLLHTWLYKDRDDGKRDGPFLTLPLAVVSALGFVFGLTFVLGFYDGRIDVDATRAAGWVIIAVTGIVLVAISIAALFFATDETSRDAQYTIIIIILLGAQSIYDFGLSGPLAPWQGLVLIGVLVVLYILVYVYIRFGPMKNKPFESEYRVRWFVIVVGLIHIGAEGIGWIVDVNTGAALWAPFTALGIYSFVLILFIFILGLAVMRQRMSSSSSSEKKITSSYRKPSRKGRTRRDGVDRR